MSPPNKTNLFALPLPLPAAELFDPLLQTDRCLIERIISTGQVTPPGQWYDQPHAEWVVLLQGSARLAYADGSEHSLAPGDYVLIAAHCRHRVVYTSTEPACVWLAVHIYPSAGE